MTEHQAACKFCRVPVTLKVHADALGMFDVEKWLSLASCNRCADYHARRGAIVAGVQRLANHSFTITSTFPEDEQHEAIARCRAALEKLTRKLAENAARHYRAGFTWEADWVTQILANPSNATMSCQFYDRQMWKDWNRRRLQETAA